MMCHGQMIDAAIRKARIAHKCGECERRIGKGDLYERQCVKSDGEVYTVKTCKRCLYAMEMELNSITDGTFCLADGDVMEWKREEANHGGWRELLAILRKGREAFRSRIKETK